MSKKTKTGAMVLVSRKLAEKMLDGSAAMGWSIADELRELLAEQPPAVGGEPETIAYLVRDGRDGQYSAHRHEPSGWAHGYQITELIDRAHVAPLLAEIDRLKAGLNWETERNALLLNRVTELEARQGEAEVWLVSYTGYDAHYFTLRSKDRAEKYKSDPAYVVTPLYRQAQPAKLNVGAE